MNIIDDRNAEQLNAMGYQTTCVAESFSSGGRITRDYDVQSTRPMRMPNGGEDFTPPANLAVISYRYTSDHWPEKFSKAATRFADALVRLLAKPDGPLVRRTARSVEFLYRLEGVVCPRLDDVTLSYSSELYAHGLTARDCNATLVLCVGCPDIPVSDESEWLAGRSPLTVARTSLPELDANAASIAVAGLVDRFAAAGDMEVNGRYLEPARTTTQHGELSLDVDPASWDPADPRRKSPGLAERVRQLREKIMGVPSRRIDDDQLRAKLEQQREATRGPGFYAPWLD
jgi:hypothetical protein